jgi:sporulation protein YlmC with PRC-barrel domain
MAYLSELTGKIVTDVNGERIGRLEDLVAKPPTHVQHPQVIAIAVKRGGAELLAPIADVAALIAPAVPLNKRLQEIVPYQPGERDLYLVRDVLDKQIIDTDGIRVVRVNDLEVVRVNGHFYVANVDIGGLGLMRRLGLANMSERVAGRLGRRLTSNSVSWDAVELLPGNQPLRLKAPNDRIADLRRVSRRHYDHRVRRHPARSDR